jgi:glucose-6-phosphate dehydrogenase assembly protein OpcA
VGQHPARVILLLLLSDVAGEGRLEARVSSHCHVYEKGQHVCSEHVTLRASGKAVGRVPASTRSLLLGDLPVAILWESPDPPPFEDPYFQEIAGLGDHFLYDSSSWSEPEASYRVLWEWCCSGQAPDVLSDLAWLRLRRWREVTAQALDPAHLPGALEAIREVRVDHEPGNQALARLLVAWLASALGWSSRCLQKTSGQVEWRFQSPSGDVVARMREIRNTPGPLCRLRITREGGAHTEVSHLDCGALQICESGDCETPHVVGSVVRERPDLLAARLAARTRDPAFRKALALSPPTQVQRPAPPA